MCLGNNLVDVARKFQAVVNVDTKIFDRPLPRNNVTSQVEEQTFLIFKLPATINKRFL